MFSFCGKLSESTKDINFGIVTRALAQLGVTARVHGRNDILIGDRKVETRFYLFLLCLMRCHRICLQVSGSAYRVRDDWFVHHGTLLVSTDLNALASYLHPDKAKLLVRSSAIAR